jgi:hypothetical protein
MKVVSGKTDDFFTGVSRPVDEGLIDIDEGSGVDIGNGRKCLLSNVMRDALTSEKKTV